MHQTYHHFDLLIINDGSTDGSEKFIGTFRDERIIIMHQENMGVSYTRNVALRYGLNKNYDAVAFLDADDYWTFNHLTNLVLLADEFVHCDVFSNNYVLDYPKKKIPKYSNLPASENQALKNFFLHNLGNSTLNCSNLMIKCSAIKTVGYFNEKLTHFEDIDWFVRIGILTKTAFSKTITVHIDEGASNRSNLIALAARILPDFSEYERYEATTLGLADYIDLNRYSIAINYKMSGNVQKAQSYKRKIALSNLSKKQRLLLSMNSNQLNVLHKIKALLGFIGIDLKTR